MTRTKKFLILFFIHLQFVVFGQLPPLSVKKIGYPLITNYSRLDYGAMSQNWDATQDSLGIMYFGNQSGLLIYDGTTWVSCALRNREGVKSLEKDANGRIFFGTNGDFGYLKADDIGRMQMVYLGSKVTDHPRQIGTISDITVIGSYVFFYSRDAIYILNTEEESITSLVGEKYRLPTKIDADYFLISEMGLLRFSKGDFEVILKEPPRFIAGYKGRLLVVSKNGDCSLFDGTNFDPSPIDPFDYARSITNMQEVDDYLVLYARDSGVVIANVEQDFTLPLRVSTGLANNSVNAAFVDAFKDLWIMHDDGISRVEWNSAYSLIDDRNRLYGAGIITEKYGDELYVGTYHGFFKAPWNDKGLGQFQKLSKEHKSYWSMLRDQEEMLAGHSDGMISIKDDKVRNILSNEETSYDMAFSIDSTFILLGTKYDFFVLRRKNGQWAVHKKILNYHQLTDFLLVIDDRSFWMANSGSGLYKLTLNEALDSLIVRTYTEDDGLPSVINNRIFLHKSGARFTADDGIYTYREKTDDFVKDSTLSDLMEHQFVFRFEESPSGKIWFVKGIGEMSRGFLVPVKDRYNKVYLPDRKLMQINSEDINPIDDFNTLIANRKGLLHIDPSRPLINPSQFRTILTRVVDITSETTLAATYFDKDRNYVLADTIQSLQFEFTAASFDNAKQNLFQWRMLGYESEWSSLKSEHRKDFTNLPYGDYTFEVRAYNVYNTEGSVAQFRFTILPPWYLTWWALSLYGLIFLCVFGLIVSMNSRRLRKENERLEHVIEERTEEIRNQRDVIEKSLLERESLLKEIHHRVKNNLQIIANLLYLQSGKVEDADFKKILEDGQGRVRSMALIHEKLYQNEDLKSISFGEYISQLIYEIKSSFGEQGAGVKVKIDAEDAYFDIDQAIPLGLIINELITNAFKYAFDDPLTGQLQVFLTYENGQYILTISDNGKGLPEEIDIRKTKSLGLRLVRMLSRQLEGEYSFDNKNGTIFSLKFAA